MTEFQTELDFTDLQVEACLEGFLYGTLSVLQIHIICQSDTTSSQDSILAYSPYIYNTMDCTKAPTPSQKNILFVFYMFYVLLRSLL